METAPRRIGVLGGTFNPVHAAHIAMAKGVRRLLDLDEILLMVAQDPPHKRVEGHVQAECRYEMACLAAQGIEGVHASDIELRRPGKSYTVDTVHELKRLYPGALLFIIVGSDMLQDLPNWKRAKELLKEAVFVSVPRQGYSEADAAAAARLQAQYGADIRMIDLSVPPISSTQVRECMMYALPITGLVPSGVEKYIYEKGLYFRPELRVMQEKCRTALNTIRYRHTMGVVRMAAALAQRYGVDAEQARLAALLHDCGRGVDKGALTHALTGERLAREDYGVTDEAVLRAIRLHTTLGPGATKLDKVIYIADMVECGRRFRGVGELRRLAMKNLDAATAKGLFDTITYVKQKGQSVHPDSLRALRELGGNPPPDTTNP